MLKNATLDAKIYENFRKIWRNFDRILTKFDKIVEIVEGLREISPPQSKREADPLHHVAAERFGASKLQTRRPCTTTTGNKIVPAGGILISNITEIFIFSGI